MSSRQGSEVVGPDAGTAPNLKHPEVLLAEIERTREDLAHTLDAIADRVSPKRVAERTRQQVTEALAAAKVVVAEQAGTAKVRATEAAGIAKVRATEAAGVARSRAEVAVAGAGKAVAGAREKVSGLSGQHAGGQHGSVALSGSASSDLPPVTPVQADGLDLSLPPAADGTPPPAAPPAHSQASTSTAPGPEVLAGGAFALLLLLLLRRRRKRRKAQRLGAVATLAGAGAELRNDFEKGRKKGRKKARSRR